MAGFIRRFGYFPGTEQITFIEGVIIVDLPPPGSVSGVGTGVACLVGEFADMSFAGAPDGNGNWVTKPQPVEVFGGQDLLNKVGGFDETIGDFGQSLGNGFVELRNKKFSRLVIVPTDLASPTCVRAFRHLPGCHTSTDPTPVVPMQGGTVLAGTRFVDGSTHRVAAGKQVTFSGAAAYLTGTDGSTPAVGPAASITFTSAGSNFLAPATALVPAVKVGDILVLNVTGQPNAGTYRIIGIPSATTLTIEAMDGTNITTTAVANQPWRIHDASCADTGVGAVATASGYSVPARPLDANILASTSMAPSVAAPVETASTWDPLSNLHMLVASGGPLVYTAALQGPNAASASAIDTKYLAAIDSLLSEDLPGREVNILWAARKSTNIRTKLKSHELDASSRGLTRSSIVSPDLHVVTASAAFADSDPGVGANRDERVDYSWPGTVTFVPEAVPFLFKTADGNFTDGTTARPFGVLDVGGDGWLAAVLSNLPPERNPGQAGAPVPDVLSPILGLQRGVSGLGMTEYGLLRQKGVCALRIDRQVGPVFQSGVTTSLIAGQKNINRRRMADFIEDSLAQRYLQFAKLPMTESWKDSVIGETDAFLSELLSTNNPAAQRISAYEIDAKSGNTKELEAKGIFVVIVRVRTLATADFIVLQGEIGEGVVIKQAA